MPYYRNPLNGEVISVDPETNLMHVCEKLSEIIEEIEPPNKAVRECSVCHMLGHNARTCPYVDEPIVASKHASPRKPQTEDDEGNPYSSKFFFQAKNLRDEEMNALQVSLEMNIPIQHINWMFQSSAYEDYQRLVRANIKKL
jgi:hypothetical protein